MSFDEMDEVLRVVYDLLNENDDEDMVDTRQVMARLGRPEDDARTIKLLARLKQADYIDGIMVMQSPAPVFIKPTEKGLQRASGWPRDDGAGELVDLLLALLDEQITQSTDEKE